MSGAARSVATCPDGEQIAIGDSDGTIRLVNIATRSVMRTIKIDTPALQKLLYLPDGSLLVAATGQKLTVYDAATGEVARRYETGETCKALGLMADGEHALAATATGRVFELSLTSGDLRDIGHHGGPVSVIALSASGRMAATGSLNGSIRLWDVRASRELHRIEGAGISLRCLTFSPDDSLLASAGGDPVVRLWSIDPVHGVVNERRVVALRQANGLQFGRNPNHLFVSSEEAFAKISRIDLQKSVTQLTDRIPSRRVRDFALTSDGRTLFTLLSDRSVHVITLDPADSTVENQFTITVARDP